ncbi:MAG: hypothetical protein Q4F51_05050, partial [Sarcina sp.]|nr:hypothetical protein [Sarcina sp.]
MEESDPGIEAALYLRNLFYLLEQWVTVQTGSKLEAFFAAFSRKTRVERRSPHSRSEFSMGERKLLSRPSRGRVQISNSSGIIAQPDFAQSCIIFAESDILH